MVRRDTYCFLIFKPAFQPCIGLRGPPSPLRLVIRCRRGSAVQRSASTWIPRRAAPMSFSLPSGLTGTAREQQRAGDRSWGNPMSKARAIISLPAGRKIKWVILAFWIVVVVLAGPLAGKLTGAEKNDAHSC